MSDEADPPPPAVPRVIEAPLASWVQDGTSTSAWDQHLAQETHDAEQRRIQEDRRLAAANTSQAQVYEHRLSDQQRDPVVVLQVLKRDRSVSDYLVCEVLHVGEGADAELVLQAVCPQCVARGRASGSVQFKIHQRNRMWWLDTRTQGELWANPANPGELYVLAGKVTTHDWIKCPTCSWRFKIDASRVFTDW